MLSTPHLLLILFLVLKCITIIILLSVPVESFWRRTPRQAMSTPSTTGAGRSLTCGEVLSGFHVQ